MRVRLLIAISAVIGCIMHSLSALAATSSSSFASESAPWVAAWANALQPIPTLADPPLLYRAPQVAGRTVRQIIYPTLSGANVRIRISNVYSRTPLTVQKMYIGESAGGAAVRATTSTPVTFRGRSTVVVAPGEQQESDSVPITLHAGRPYAISTYMGPTQTLTVWHRVANQLNYVSVPGDHTADLQSSAYSTRFTQYAWLSAVSVQAPLSSAVAAMGDSITDGLRSSLNQNRRWPDVLARRLAAQGKHSIAVLNLGISGNRLLSDSRCYGQALEQRFERDALTHPGVKAVVLLIGINDINFAAMPPRAGLDCDFPHTQVSAKDLIAGYQRLILITHRHHVQIFGATLTPASLPSAREQIRTTVNAWIRSSGAFDGVIDFDAALRDPTRLNRLQPYYDSGDHVHPNDAGYAAMAAAVPLDLLTNAASR